MKTNYLITYILIAVLLTLSLGYLVENPLLANIILTFSGLYALSYNGNHNTRLLGTSFLLALLLSLPFLYYRDFIIITYWMILFPSVFYIVHCFHAAFHEKSGFNILYTDLFYAGWNTIIVLVIAAFFALLVNGLIVLLISMLEIVGIHALVITRNVYYIIFTVIGLLIIGIGIIKQNLPVVYKTRLLGLQLAYFIYPLIIILSIIALILYGLSYNNQENLNALTPFLLAFFILGVLFFNAVFQEGKRLPSYSHGLHYIVKIYPIFLACLATILFYKAMKHGFSIRNLWLLSTLILLYGFGYAITVFLKEEKAIFFVKSINVGLAIYFVIVALIANTTLYVDDTESSKNAPPLNEPVLQNFHIEMPSSEQKAKLMEVFNSNNEKLAKNSVSWKSYSSGQILPKHATICQVPYKDGFEPGSIIEKQCIITYGGNILAHDKFLFLDIASNKTSWQPHPAKYPLPLGIEFVPEQMSTANPTMYLRVLYVCKAPLDGRDYIGKVVGNYCNIAYRGKEKPVQDFQVLGKRPL